MQIAVFGGSFDPPHWGHFISSQQLIDFGFADEVWLMPCYAHVWGKKISSVEHRLAMTRLLESRKIKVSTLEIEAERALYTIETLEVLKRQFPKERFFWVIGEKNLAELPKWKDYQKLIKNYQFLVLPQESRWLTLPSANFIFISHPLWVRSNLSSSIVRERVKQGLSLEGFIPEKVRRYVVKNKLYR